MTCHTVQAISRSARRLTIRDAVQSAVIYAFRSLRRARQRPLRRCVVRKALLTALRSQPLLTVIEASRHILHLDLIPSDDVKEILRFVFRRELHLILGIPIDLRPTSAV
jgi:hypothetical protein